MWINWGGFGHENGIQFIFVYKNLLKHSFNTKPHIEFVCGSRILVFKISVMQKYWKMYRIKENESDCIDYKLMNRSIVTATKRGVYHARLIISYLHVFPNKRRNINIGIIPFVRFLYLITL